MSILKIKNLQKYYGSHHALKNINLEVKQKEVVVILGPSGCGKSTL
ncbi:amino acid ABC transporter, ATP-binding protein, partial [Campylobacter coli 2685]